MTLIYFYYVVLIVGALLLAMLIVDAFIWLMSHLVDYIRYHCAEKGDNRHEKVRNSYYIQSLQQCVYANIISRLDLLHSVWWRRKPNTETPYKSDGNCAKKNCSENPESSLHPTTVSYEK